jgi:hypothetical protein
VEIPHTFTTELSVEFQDRLRARYSPKQNAIVIEQRVGKNIIGSIPRRMIQDNERRQSLAEGYKPFMTIAISEKVRCPECDYWIEVPNRETRQVKCLYCKLKGRNTSLIAGYYPLNHHLINHLKSIDPLRNMDDKIANKLTEQNEKIAEQQQKQLSNDAEAYTSDNLNRLMQIPTFGYSGTKAKEGTEVKGF